MRKLWLILSLTFAITNLKAEEYKSLEEYLTQHPTGKHSGQDGHWLETDRKKHNHIWAEANQINFRKNKGYLEYRNIAERSDFYEWFQQLTDSLGFETRWGYAAALTTKKLEKLLSNAAEITGSSNDEIQTFVIKGNEVIFNDIWPDLKKLITQKPLTGKHAETWDGDLLLKEQNLIEPYYEKLSHDSLVKLEKLLRKENFFSRLLPGYEFEGQLLSIEDRWFYGMKLMRYKAPDLNRISPVH